MSRRFLPNLLGGGVPRGLEGKSAWVGALGGRGTFQVRSSAAGSHEDRAAGWDMDAVVTEGYERSVWVYRCIDLIASSSSTLPFTAGRNMGKDDEELLEDHPLYRVLNGQANPLETGEQFRYRLSSQALLSKRGAFVEVTKSRMGTITRLDLLDPSRTRPVPSDNGDYLSHFELIRRDGVVREIDPERIRWVRRPHPTDPYCGNTPLEAAGISVELDHLSRVYNVTFIRNDSRPGGVLAVDTDSLTDGEMTRLERRFKGGALHAGELAVVAAGQGGIRYVDTTTRPRDMAYGETSTAAKTEILAAFNIGESVLGNSSGRTFDNAEQEEYTFWTKPMPPHNGMIAGAFARDFEDDWKPFLDTSSVEVLELPERKKRDEARQEVREGLRSIDEYRPLARLKPMGNAHSRALWVSPAKAPIPATPEDAAALGQESPVDAGPLDQPVDPALDGAPVEGETAADAVAEARAEGGPLSAAAQAVDLARQEGADAVVDGAAAAAVAAARQEGSDVVPDGAAADAVAQARLERKDAHVDVEVKAVTRQATTLEYDGGTDHAARVELAVAGALEALLVRQSAIYNARLEGRKARKGTRFWRPDGDTDTRGGDQPIDMGWVLDVTRWTGEVNDTLAPLVQAAVAEAGAEFLGFLASNDVLAGAGDEDRDDTYWQGVAGRVGVTTTLTTLVMAHAAIADLIDGLRTELDTAQLVAEDLVALTDLVRDYFGDRAGGFARSVGRAVAVAAVNGSREAVAESLLPAPGAPVRGIVRGWITRQDAQVRDTHRAVHGTTLAVGEPFIVGLSRMRFPQDPTAPPSETRGCRCHLRYQVSRAGRYLAPPMDTAA